MKAVPDIDITVVVTFHREGPFAIPALRSLRDLVVAGGSEGAKVEVIATIDRPDEVTRRVLETEGSFIGRVEIVDFGDLARCRNYAVDLARGRYTACLDGDDLWGEQWLAKAWQEAEAADPDSEVVFHPEWLFYFSEADFAGHALGKMPSGDARSFFMRQQASCDPLFDPRLLALQNIWSANAFARTDVYRTYPYRLFDRQRGVGIEDWSWNIETIHGGVAHSVVPGTVHLIRQKSEGSLGAQNFTERLLTVTPGITPWSVPGARAGRGT